MSLFKSTRQHLFWKCDLNFAKFVFDYRSGQMGTENHKNFDLQNEYLDRTRRPRGLFCLLKQLKSQLSLMGVPYSAPEVHELVAQRWAQG
jgi:hypothetical protein